MVIDTSSRLDQVKVYLLNYINQHGLIAKDQLPSETAIAKTLGVSRNTLREAYIELESEGIIIRRHGLGTFVARSPIIHDSLNDFSPFTQIIRESGFTPGFKTIAIDYERAPLDVSNVFSSPASQKVHRIKRLVLADRQPVIYVEDYLSPAMDWSGLQWDSFDGNMVQFISSSLDHPLHHFLSHIRAASLAAEYSPYLELDVNTPILSVRSIIYKEDNLPILYSKMAFNSNIVELSFLRMIPKT